MASSDFNMKVLLFLIFWIFAVFGQSNLPRPLGSINVTHPWFSAIYTDSKAVDPTEKYSILLTTFNGASVSKDPTWLYQDIGKYLDDVGTAPGTNLYPNFNWPEIPLHNPDKALGFSSVSIPQGFNYPGQDDGTIWLLDMRDPDNAVAYDIGNDPGDPNHWFYWQVSWKDVNGDGLQDIVTCRVQGQTPDSPQLVWLEQPVGGPFSTTPWAIRVLLTDVCDAANALLTLDTPSGPMDALFTTGQFTNLLSVVWSTDPSGRWNDTTQLQYKVIDQGSVFYALQVGDVNKDGRPDLLAPDKRATDGSFFAYEIPDDFRTGDYKRHTLASGFTAIGDLTGVGAPGEGIPFYPNTASQTGKPLIALAGMDDGTMYILSPNSEDPEDWTYTQETLLVAEDVEAGLKTLANAVFADVDGDGWNEMFFSSYYEYLLNVCTFAPQ